MSDPNKARVVLHCDMDAFYASIEQRDDPSLVGKAVIVGATSNRGVVAAASYEARRFGVRSAMPGFRARELCPDGVFLPSDMARYSRVSDEVHEVLQRFSSQIEPIALDEAFLDISGSVNLFGGPITLARKLKAAVRESVGLPISVGIGPNKLVAKIACTLSKPDGMIFVPDDAVTWLLFPLPVRRLWGVGPVLEETLTNIGIATIGDLARYDSKALGAVVGDRVVALQQLARGDDPRVVEAPLIAKSYGEENTFGNDVTDRAIVTAALTSHAEAVARRLRNDGLHGRTVTLKIKLGRARGVRIGRTDGEREPIYPLLTRARTLAQSTSDGALIRETAISLWDAAKIDEPVRLLGVSMSNIEARVETQLDLFARKAGEDRLGRTLDAITERFGKGAIRRAVEDPEKATQRVGKSEGNRGKAK